MLFTDNIFQGALILAVNRAIAIIVFKSFMRTNDVILGIPAIQADHHGG